MATAPLEPDTRSITKKCLSEAWDAFHNHRPELGSKLVWDAAEAALRQLARQQNYAIDTLDQRFEFVELLDAQNGNGRYYIGQLMMCEYFEDNATMGVMPGDDPASYVTVATEFIEHLLDLAEDTQ